MVTLPGFVFPLLIGISIGVLFSYSVVNFTNRPIFHIMKGSVWPTNLSEQRNQLTEAILSGVAVDVNQISFTDSKFHGDDTTIADRLNQTVRILCLVMTYPKNHKKKAIHVKATWGKRCNKLLFVTRTSDDNLTTLILNVSDGRNFLGDKTRGTFDYAYEHYLEDFDWFLKADDDTYVIMENLRYFLSEQDSNSPLFFGQTFTLHVKNGYPSGGAGYVASREAVRRYGLRRNQTLACGFNSGAEDIDFGRCMESLGVKFGDSLDALGRTRFHPFDMKVHIAGRYPSWFLARDKYKGTKTGLGSLSDYSISFHYIGPDDMYLLEFFVYHLNPYGIIKELQKLNQIPSNGTTN